MATALDLDEELSIEEAGWRGRFLTLGVLMLVGAFIAAGAWYFLRDDDAGVARATEDIPVKRATINSNLIISGTADTQLNSDLVFQSAGKVASVDVRVGDLVRQGQALATLESEDLANAVESAEANVLAAQLKVDDLLSGSTSAELAGAEQVVSQSAAALTKAENDYQDLLEGADASELATAQQGVSLAESQVATARSAREKLANTPSAADLAAAEAGVAAAESSLTAAENSAENAENTVNSAAASLRSAESSYCSVDSSPSFCPGGATPISSGDLSILNNALGGPNASAASAAIAANSTYLNAENSVASAEAAVDSANNALDSAEARLSSVEDGPTAEEFAAADAGIASAEAALRSADEKLALAQSGATDLQLSTALAAVTSARSTLASAIEKRTEARRGPEANAVAQARQAVRAAQLTVEAARIRLKNAQIIAPFDGTVAAVNITAGEFTSAAATAPAIVLLTPDAVLLKLSVGETDYPNLKLDQGGIVIFDGIPGKPYPFRVTEIGLSPTVTQGVVTYDVKGSLVVLPGSPRPAPGMNARGEIVTSSKPDILVIAPRAIRRKGTEQVVDVRRDGVVQEVVITTGISDNDNVEVLTGLNEGDLVVVPALVSLAPSGAAGQLQTPLPNNIR